MARKPSKPAIHTLESPALPSTLSNPSVGSDLAIQLFHELAPVSAYEKLVAQNIIANEQQAMDLRKRRDAILRHRAGDMIALKLVRRRDRKEAGPDPQSDADIRELVRAWIFCEQGASGAIADHDIDEERALTDAYIEYADLLNDIGKQLNQLENRRRRLRDDYRTLQIERHASETIEDAEILGGSND
ncbi:hypothetical protein OE699_02135 [Sedimentimonas flavescens]|uniref:Terminase small subunit n=1 Tax=Sedimentimonas flavescens TaxID=2851012 RepID=A0ABT2ZV70_9RHOB|nr:hypothetical protein [Sedimentimonas flavescens]MCV2877639.1 hypothetical protein [Sedimentimonas flavescens]